MSDEQAPSPAAVPAWFPWAARACALAGGGLVTYGVAAMYRPAGFLVAGVMLLVLGIGALK